MSNANPKPNRWMLPARKGAWSEVLEFLRKPEVWSRVGVCLIATTVLWLVTSGWAPPFEWRVRQSPLRDLHAKVAFEYPDSWATAEARNVARTKVLCPYENDPQKLEDFRQELVSDLFKVVGGEFEDLENSGTWSRFMPPSLTGYTIASPIRRPVIEPLGPLVPEGPTMPGETGEETPQVGLNVNDAGPHFENAQLTDAQRIWLDERNTREADFQLLRNALLNDERLEVFQKAINAAFIEFDRNGLFVDLEHTNADGSLTDIEVYPKGNLDNAHRVVVTDVRISQTDILRDNLRKELAAVQEDIESSARIADLLFEWTREDDETRTSRVSRLPETLKWNAERSRIVARTAASLVKPVNKTYQPGDALPKLTFVAENAVITAGVPLDDNDIKLLSEEHSAHVGSLTSWDRFLRSLFFFGCFGVIFSLVSGVLFYRDRHLLDDFKQFSTLIGLMAVALGISWALTYDVHWRAEVIPIVIFAMLLTIAYNIELSLILSALVAIAFTVIHGFGFGEFLILTAASSTTAMLCRRIRSRTKLVYVGLTVAVVIFPTVIGIQYLLGQPLSRALWMEAIWFAGSCGFAGLFMTALLPFLESWFDIQTDISLLELSDANHPLLKQLVQRAPGTYNHSINVASLSESAADSINANGLLCRVGAYFHDIGKVRKPEYFIENQAGFNPHDELEPSMSKMIITAHVKDGCEIARKHRLPRRIIDLIEQHHGNTLVEYFFHRASKKQEADEDAAVVDESEFRYPGPRPQSIEAAVMMLADGVESASRALREPTPARLESQVREIGKKKLDDGQFDECGITLSQLNTVQESLIKSLNAMYHARVSYPEKTPGENLK